MEQERATSGIPDILRDWLRRMGIRPDPTEVAIRRAHYQLNRLVFAGSNVPDDIAQPILDASEVVRVGRLTPEIEKRFYQAYARLTRLAPFQGREEDDTPPEPLRDALDDAGLLLKSAAEMGIEVSRDIAQPILAASAAYKSGEIDNTGTANFYDAYGKLAKLFGEVTADTIRACASEKTSATLRRNRLVAVCLTVVIAAFSVLSFVADAMSKGVVQDIASANSAAATLRAALTPAGANLAIDIKYVQNDPCDLITSPSTVSTRTVQTVNDVQQLQEFTSTVRDLRNRAIKLNWFVLHWECDAFDPLAKCAISGSNKKPLDSERLNRQLQLNPAILDYTAEVLCKIQSYQIVRTFATNVQMDYAAVVGAFASYALPIVYALLGAYAFRLRLFVETIRKKTYHPSFADSARMITAVIAGAIAGLFNPAEGLSLSPLATAFLVGYGVELFFRFLDSLINAFGSSPAPRH